jgi:hypothetical protein
MKKGRPHLSASPFVLHVMISGFQGILAGII